MDGIKQTSKPPVRQFKDVVHVFVLRARPRMGDIGQASAVITSYFAPFITSHIDQRRILELGEPEQLNRNPDVRSRGLVNREAKKHAPHPWGDCWPAAARRRVQAIRGCVFS